MTQTKLTKRAELALAARREDAFYQVITLSEVHGRAFYFGRQKPKDFDFPGVLEFNESRAKNPRLEDPYDIEFNPKYGRPGPLAYSLWAALEKKMSDGGKTFDGKLRFTSSKLAFLAGRDSGGRDFKQLDIAVRQLRTMMVYHWSEQDVIDEVTKEVSSELVSKDFNLISSVTRVISKKNGEARFFEIEIDPHILKLLQEDQYFFCMSSARIAGLKPQSHSVARILYRYLSYRYSATRDKGVEHTKDYATMCEVWLGGVKPLGTISQIKQKHIGPRFDPIKERGIISSYKIVKNVNKNGFNIIVKPGKGFLEDYKTFYDPQMVLPLDKIESSKEPLDMASEDNYPDELLGKEDGTDSEVIALLQHFARTWHGQKDDFEFSEKEIIFARDILSQSNAFEAKTFVDFGIQEARKTNFEMASFNGLKQYRSKWSQRKLQEAQKMNEIAQETERDIDRVMTSKYEDFLRDELDNIMSEMDETALSQTREKCLQQLQLEFPENEKFMDAWIDSAVRTRIREEHDLPTYESWKKNRGF